MSEGRALPDDLQPLANAGGPMQVASMDLDNDPVFGALLRGEAIPGRPAAGPPPVPPSASPAALPQPAATTAPPTGGPPNTGYPYESKVPPVREGFQPVYNPAGLTDLSIASGGAGIPIPGVEQALKTYQSGYQLYVNPRSGESYMAPYAFGPADPGRVQFEEATKSRGTATGPAETDVINVPTIGPGGQIISTPMTRARAAQMPQIGGPPGAGPGPATTAPGAGPGGPAPSAPAAPAPGTPVGMPVAIPGQEGVTKRLGDLQTNADQAQQELNTVLNMRDIYNRGMQTGWGAEIRADFARALNAVPGISPDAVKRLAGIDPADADAFQKQALRLSTEGVRTLGAREPGSIVQMFTRAYPSLETQPGALDLMTNILGQEQRRILDKRNFMVDNLSNAPAAGYGPLGIQGAQLQAERSFDQTNPAANYLRSAYLMTGTRPGGPSSDWYKQAWTPDTYTTGPDGKITLTDKGRAMLGLVPQGTLFYGIDGKVHPRQ